MDGFFGLSKPNLTEKMTPLHHEAHPYLILIQVSNETENPGIFNDDSHHPQ